MAISAMYKVLNEIINDEIQKGRTIAIFPMGRIGLNCISSNWGWQVFPILAVAYVLWIPCWI